MTPVSFRGTTKQQNISLKQKQRLTHVTDQNVFISWDALEWPLLLWRVGLVAKEVAVSCLFTKIPCNKTPRSCSSARNVHVCTWPVI